MLSPERLTNVLSGTQDALILYGCTHMATVGIKWLT